jgi:streptogramin lyase
MGSGVNGGLTFGDKAVGIGFNPSGNVAVDELKKSYAYIIDTLDFQRTNSSEPEVKRLCSVAITEAQTAQMWAVKAITWNDK